MNGKPSQDAKTNRELHMAGKIASLIKENNALRKELGQQETLVQQVCDSVNIADPPPHYKFTCSKGAPIASAVIKLSDWHIGEIVREDETEGFGKYNLVIAKHRIVTIIDSFLKWVEAQRSLYCIDECHVFGEGDFTSGLIHQELMTDAEFPAPVQVAEAGLLLGEVLRMVSGRFKRVDAVLVGADNHGRLERKPRAKQKAANNLSYLVNTIAKTYARDCKNINAPTIVAAKHLHKVHGYGFLIEHGDGIRGWSGIPFYGIQRSNGRESRRRMNTDKGFHYHSIAHYHVPFLIDDTLGNGSLTGTTEFDHLAARHAPPSQVAFLVSPNHGIFNWTPFGA